MQPTTPTKRSSSSTVSTTDAAPPSEQTSRIVGLGLRNRSRGNSATPNKRVQKETYTWRGIRYEIEEDTPREWLEDDIARKRRASIPDSADAQRETMAATASQLIVKLPVPLQRRAAPVARMVTSPVPKRVKRPLRMVKLPLGSPAALTVELRFAAFSEASSASDAESSPAMDIDSDTPPERDSSSSSSEPSGATAALEPYWLNWHAPYVTEPDMTTEFYGTHMFLCVWDTVITNFLKQLDSRYLKCLKPGSVRMSVQFPHMGYNYAALKNFNLRRRDGLRPDVAVVPITVENEEDTVWVSWDNVDDFDGLTGGSGAGDGMAAKRRPPARLCFDSDDDELYT